jgi:hypothetical protein
MALKIDFGLQVGMELSKRSCNSCLIRFIQTVWVARYGIAVDLEGGHTRSIRYKALGVYCQVVVACRRPNPALFAVHSTSIRSRVYLGKIKGDGLLIFGRNR